MTGNLPQKRENCVVLQLHAVKICKNSMFWSVIRDKMLHAPEKVHQRRKLHIHFRGKVPGKN